MNLDKRVNGATILTGLLGNPVEHTVSPVLHNSLFSIMNINGIYIPMKVPEAGLKDAVYGLKATGFTGFNVTIPYKKAIMEYLDEVSDEAVMLGAVNTVRISEGRLYGYNTDGYGFNRSFRERTGTGFDGKTVCILGAGGTARALAVKMVKEGAEKIYIINRTELKASELASEVNSVLAGMGCRRSVDFARAGTAEAARMLERCDIIVNATSAGMHPHIGVSPLQDDFVFRENQIVYDVIYNPPKTKLLKHAELNGCVVVNGAHMLFYQGVKAFEIWLGVEVPGLILETVSKEFLKYLEYLEK